MRGDPVVILAGFHVGCFELFSNDHVRSISDLRGKTDTEHDGSTTALLRRYQERRGQG